MINFKSFKNASEFLDIFGWRECGNGAKARKNKILLNCLRNRDFFKLCVRNPEYEVFLSVRNMADFKAELLHEIAKFSYTSFSRSLNEEDGVKYSNFDCEASGFVLRFFVPNMEVIDGGICEDGDSSAVRYRNIEADRIYKMKAGKFFTKTIDGCEFGKALPQQAKSWLGEEFLTSWQAYAEPRTKSYNFEFHYGDSEADFETIYSSSNRRGDFNSCMTDQDYYDMYSNSCKCHAAWLTDENGLMFARCVIWDEVYDLSNGSTLRLAERQYSDGVQDRYKKMLVDELIKRGLIDGYKQIGASCHDNRAFVLNDGRSLSGDVLCIDCNIDFGDHVSYMDSFVYYDRRARKAYNTDHCNFDVQLDTTDGYMEDDDRLHEDDNWSEYHEEWISSDESIYVDSRDDYFYENECVQDYNGDWQFEDDCVNCERCGSYVNRDDAFQIDDSKFDDMFFCDESCAKDWLADNGYEWCDWDECYDDDPYDVYVFENGYWEEKQMTYNTFHNYSEAGNIKNADDGAYLVSCKEEEEEFEKITAETLVEA